MKKLFLLSFCALFFTLSSTAQIKLRLGAIGGVSITGLTTGKGVTNFDNYNGYNVGLLGEVSKVNSVFALSAGISLSERGAIYKTKESKSKYISLPVYLVYKYPLLKHLSVYGGLGPYASLRLSGNSYLKGVGDDENGRWYAERFTVGANGKLGVELFKHFQLGAEYQRGFLDDYKSNNYGAKNSSWAFNLGMLF